MTTEKANTVDVPGLWAKPSEPILLTRTPAEIHRLQGERVATLERGDWPAELAALPQAEKDRLLRVARKTLEDSARVLEKRKGDAAYVIRVQHVGSPDDPARWEELAAEFTERDHAATVKARRLLMEEFGDAAAVQEAMGVPFKKAVEQRAATLPERNAAQRDLINARLDLGLVGGKAERERLWNLGGWRLLLEAHEEVRRYQEVTPELGEG